MKLPTEDIQNLSKNSKNQKDLFQLLEEKNDDIVKKQYKQNELFQAQHYLKDYVNNLRKQTVLGLDEEIRKTLFINPKRREEGRLVSSINVRENNKMKLSIKKKEKMFNFKNRRLSDNVTKRNITFEKFKNDKNEEKTDKEKSLIIQKRNSSNTYSHTKSLELKGSLIFKTISSKTLSKRCTLEKSLTEEERKTKNSFVKKNNFSLLNKPKVFNGENDDKSIVIDNRKNSFFKNSKMSNKDIIQLNELQKELKRTIIGKSSIIGLDSLKLFLMDEKDEIKQKNDKKENEKYRILTRKGYVYDSFDDEENLDKIMNFNYIHPNSLIIEIIDFFVVVFTFYNLIYIPLFLAKNDIYCVVENNFSFMFFLNIFIDIIFVFDLIISFFIGYYDFDETFVVEYALMANHYLETWFLCDFISAFPFQTLFRIFDNKCKEEGFLVSPIYAKNFYYLLILLRLIKIFKIISKNKFLTRLLKELSKLKHLSNIGSLLINTISFFISIHIVACIFIFIGKNDYPNWIIHFGHNNKSFSELYLIAIYYTITTLTTVGYGDLSCISSNEKLFGLFMEVVGICVYSWALTEISNYIKVINEKSEELTKRIQILDDIKLTYRHFPDDLYERIVRHLKYKHYNEKRNNIHMIFEELPIGLRNSLIYEIYKPIIHNFNFFKDFQNIDFIVKVILSFKPILALKNDILIKNGDLVDEIIFVKKGNLSLEVPFTFKQSVNRKSGSNARLMRRSALFYNAEARENVIDDNNVYNLNRTITKNRTFKTGFTFVNALQKKHKEEKEKIHYFRILKIRRNEHFGDILMLLDQRSPLCLRVHSKKAELFFLNKEDAVNISTSYPQYWKKINKKSLFNMEQIKRLTNKIIKLISSQHGFVAKKNVNQIKNTNISSSISIIDDDDYDLKTIPSFSQNTEIQNNNNELIEEIENNENEEEEYEEEEEIEEKDEENKNINVNKEKKNYMNSMNLQPIIEDDNNKESNSNSYSSSSITESGFEKKNSNKSDSIKLSSISNKSNVEDTSKLHSTPYEYDEINNEIYPEENFVISPLINTNCEMRANTIYKINLDNVSVCSTEISFSINSEYENIDELSDHTFSKDLILREKVKNFIQEEMEKKAGNIRINKYNTDEKNDLDYCYNQTFKVKFKANTKKSMVKRTKTTNSFQFKKIQSLKKNNNGDKRNKDSNRELLNVDSNDEDDKNKNENKKDILNVISQKIEKDNMKLNNPDLFYSKAFKKIINKKKTEIKESNDKLEKSNKDKKIY